MTGASSGVSIDTMHWDPSGLLPAVAQDALTGEVRMLAFVDREALAATVATGEAHFHSRSRGRLWKKGESSGHVLKVQAIHVDCDHDAVLYLVEPLGPTCHTGEPGCFFQPWDGAPPVRALPFTERLEAILQSRRTTADAGSYTRRLLDAGAGKIGEKIREEADELARAVADESDERVASEAADVLYHVLVGLVSRGVAWRTVLAELWRRFGTSGLAEKAARTPRSAG